MNKPELTILLPHLRGPANDRALRIALDCLLTNTQVNFELIVNTSVGDVYEICNQMAARAAADWIVFTASDVFMAPGWDMPMLESAQVNRIVTGVIVECGAIGVNVLNHHRNFGMTPESFDREAFETWCRVSPETPSGYGWYFPSLHHREAFLDFGGFDLSRGPFPEPLDSYYWTKWRKAGREVHRVPSFCYHLQNYSNEAEQVKAVRHG